MPFLQSIGLSPDDIRLEYTFEIKLIREVTAIGRNKEECKKHGRADILCRTKDGRNLFIIELKAIDKELSEDDKWQGITYARLLEQIAPLVVLTNGMETRLYDSISGEEIKNDDPQIKEFLQGRRPDTKQEINTRVEALEYFIGMSFNNLGIFCEHQHRLHLLPLQELS